MNRALKILTGVGAGIAAAYLLDPRKGADRRAMLKDKFNAFRNDPKRTISDLTDGIRDQAKTYTNDAKELIGGTEQEHSNKEQTDFTHSNQPFQTTH